MSRYGTPLRYPGGKQRLAAFFVELLEGNDAVGWNYVEPYAGGAGIAINLLLREKVSHIFLNDSSLQIYALWQSLLNAPDDFCSRISRASLTITEWKRHREIVRHPSDHDLPDVGFSTFYLNRCNRSGVLGAGVIGGLAQGGRWRMDARFPRNELIKRVEAIAVRKKHVTLTNLDAEQFIAKRVSALPASTLIYCDPPYYTGADRLYLNTYDHDDHVRLAKLIQHEVRHPWVVSYDGHPEIISLYVKRRQFLYSLQYSATRVRAGTEVFVFADNLKLPSTSGVPCIAKALSGFAHSA